MLVKDGSRLDLLQGNLQPASLESSSSDSTKHVLNFKHALKSFAESGPRSPCAMCCKATSLGEETPGHQVPWGPWASALGPDLIDAEAKGVTAADVIRSRAWPSWDRGLGKDPAGLPPQPYFLLQEPSLAASVFATGTPKPEPPCRRFPGPTAA